MNTKHHRNWRGPAAIVVHRKHHFNPMPGVQGRRPDSHTVLSSNSTPRNLNDSIQCPKCESNVPLRKIDTHRRQCFNIL